MFICHVQEWSREMLLEKWMRDPVDCCQAAGVQAPNSVLHHGSSLESNTSPDISEEKRNPEILVIPQNPCPDLFLNYKILVRDLLEYNFKLGSSNNNVL